MEWNVHSAIDGLDAMDFLLQRGKHLSAPRPDLILLDLNLPKKDGRQVLKEVKDHPRLRQIPVLIQTSSTAEEDIFASYDSHANGYLLKPMSLDELSLQLSRIEEFWFRELKLPNERKSIPGKLHDEEYAEPRDQKLYLEKYDISSYDFFMKVTALIPDSLVKDVRKFSKGKNITESLIIALNEWINIQKFNLTTEKIRKHPLKFSPGFSADSIRALNRKK